MKSIMLILVAVCMLFAQNVTIPIESLPLNMQAKYKTENTINTISENSKSIKNIASNVEDIGKSVGSAISSGLGAISTEANKFADTKVGLFTAIIIGWKVLGTDVKDLTSGLIFILFTSPIALFFIIAWIWSFKRLCLPTKFIKQENFDSDGKKTSVEYGYESPEELDLVGDKNASTILHGVVLVFGVLIYFTWVWNAIF